MTWDEFRAAHPADVVWVRSFNQGILTSLNTDLTGTVDLSLVRRSGAERVSDGVCRELCRMWLFVRNVPEVAASAPAKKDQPLELAYLTQHYQSIMMSQALFQTGVRDRDEPKAVFGLATGKNKMCGDAGALYARLISHGGALAMATVAEGGGYHALGFDMRGGEFVMFDPNKGLFRMPQGARAKTVLTDYCDTMDYTPRHMCQYTRTG